MAGPYEPEDASGDVVAADDELLVALRQANVPDWSDPQDLARMSVEAFVGERVLERLSSAGQLRIFGDGVAGTSARLDVVGAFCQDFQRAVVSVGASLAGFKGTRGRLPEAVASRSRMNLVAAPSAGSVVLNIAPAADPNGETQPGGVASMVATDRPLADQTMETVIRILTLAASEDVEATQLEADLNSLGPRSATALGSLARTLGEDQLSLQTSWSEPGRATLRSVLTPAQARWLDSFVRSRKLDEAPVTLRGQLRTISDRRALELLTDEGETLTIGLGTTDPAELEQFTIRSGVRIEAVEKVSVGVGGAESRTYTLVSVHAE